MRASSARTFSAQSRAPSSSKIASACSSASRAGRFILARRRVAPERSSVRACSNGIETRSCSTKRLLQRDERAFEIAARGGDEASAAAADASAEARSSCAACRSRMPSSASASSDATECDQRFDLVSGEAHGAGLPDAARLELRAERAKHAVHRIEPLEREL